MSSWLPFGLALPVWDLSYFSLPSGSIQARFISYLLKRTLGHLLKPGQLDAHQIDAQIGSGFVDVNALELDPDAINPLLVGLPFQLARGQIGKVTVRIPWPNPLTSSVGFSARNLHLTLRLTPTQSTARPSGDPVDLADSVTSLAQSFLHEELSVGEEADLYQSMHLEPPHASREDLGRVPGGLDPFLHDPDTPDDVHRDMDPEGISIFASLVERLLARFCFDAEDTVITIAHEGHANFTIQIPRIQYATDGQEPLPVEAMVDVPSETGVRSVTRSLTVQGATLSLKQLRLSAPDSPDSSLPRSSSPASSSQSDSDMDEETQMMMSQSIFLPPRPSSPSESVTSSMYQSAVSELDSLTADPLPGYTKSGMSGGTDTDESVIVGLAMEPLVVQLVTNVAVPHDAPSRRRQPESVQLSVSMGVLACAFDAHSVRCVLEALRYMSTHTPPAPSAQGLAQHIPSNTSPLSELLKDADLRLHLRAITVVILQSRPTDPSDLSALSSFFGHPFSPPQLSLSYCRLHIEGIDVSCTCFSTSSSTNTVNQPRIPSSSASPPSRPPHSASPSSQSVTFTISDFSVLGFLVTTPARNSDIATTPTAHSIPILFTDSHLPSQYSTTHYHPQTDQEKLAALVSFEVTPPLPLTGWTAKISTWRTKAPQDRRTSLNFGQNPRGKLPGRSEGSSPQTGLVDLPSPSTPSRLGAGAPRSPPVYSRGPSNGTVESHRASLQGNMRFSLRNSPVVSMHIAPLQFFLDVTHLPAVLLFVEHAAPLVLHPPGASVRHAHADTDEENLTPPATPRPEPFLSKADESERERERRRLEKFVLDDLALELDYTPMGTRDSASFRKTKTKRAHKANSPTEATLEVAMIRIHARSPRPPRFAQDRSGAVIIDVHQLVVFAGPLRGARDHPTTRLANDSDDIRRYSVDAVVSAEFGRLLVACTMPNDMKASALLSLGPLSSRNADEDLGSTPTRHTSAPVAPRSPSLVFSSAPTGALGSTAPSPMSLVSLDLPSVHAYVPKLLLDNLQLWADDLAQFLERQFVESAAGGSSSRTSETGSTRTQKPSRNPSLIGSRYFTRQRWPNSQSPSDSDSGSGVPASPVDSGQFTASVRVTEVFACFPVHRGSITTDINPFDLSCSDLCLLLESNAEGKGDMVVTLDVMDIKMRDFATIRDPFDLFSITNQRRLLSEPKPMIKLQLTSAAVPHTIAKETRIRLTLSDFTFYMRADTQWIHDLARYAKSPPGAFEAVVPSERTVIIAKIMCGSICVLGEPSSGRVILTADADISTTLMGDSKELSIHIYSKTTSIFFLDNIADTEEFHSSSTSMTGAQYWHARRYPLIADLSDLDLRFGIHANTTPTETKIVVDGAILRIHLCADTISGLGRFAASITSTITSETPSPSRPVRQGPTNISQHDIRGRGIMSSLDEQAFGIAPEVGLTADMINDDLPSNADYLDASFGPAAGLRELVDEDLEDFAFKDEITEGAPGIISNIGGETIKVLIEGPIRVVEHHFDTLPPELDDDRKEFGKSVLDMHIHNADVVLFMYGGYDSSRIRKTIEEKAKEMRRKLAKIRQLLAEGQTYDPSLEDASTVLFNSVHLGLEQDMDALEPGAIIAAIDDELNNGDIETGSQSSWQSFRPAGNVQPTSSSPKVGRKRLERSRHPCIEFRFSGIDAVYGRYRPDSALVSRVLATIQNFEILDHIKTSTWKKFLTDLRADSHGNVRETDSNMVRVELRIVRPAQGHSHEEARLKAKLLPLRLHVDQDALDFMKVFFAFKDSEQPSVQSAETPSENDIFFQFAEIFPVGIKLDYKPRRVDYKALKEGRTIELMNFFHFDGAEMTLRHITLSGITGWPRLFDTLNDLWTPDVKANQLADIISGVAPIRSMVNVGSGVADLVLLPIAQYRKDGRVVRGLQKGTAAFLKSSAIEAIKLGARLATGTQVILEQAENVIGGQFKTSITAEALQTGVLYDNGADTSDSEEAELISRYAEQPTNVREGVQSAYKSLSRNMNAAAQTILAVPMEVYERSGSEGPVRAVVRAVPIAVLKPMIGASEAVSKTLLGLQNSMDPSIRYEAEDKYKHR